MPIIYLLSNPAMPGIIKIGNTSQNDVQSRMAQLYTTGVPVPFECVYAAEVPDAIALERALHNAFAPQRVNPRREFFQIDPTQALGIIKLIQIKEVTPQVLAQKSEISEAELEAGQAIKKRRPNLNFEEMQIPIGSQLVNISTGELIVVASAKTVMFRDQELSLTAATRFAQELEYNVAPTPYWTYNGKSLQEIYDETYLREI
jgi:hypothetical protein